MKREWDVKTMKSVRIDARTIIYVSKSIPDDIARQNYLNRIQSTSTESKRFRDLRNASDRLKTERERVANLPSLPELPEEEAIPEESEDEFEDLEES